MKKIYLFLIAIAGIIGVHSQDCSNQIDTLVFGLGFNPNPLPAASGGVYYDHINTIVLPGRVDNTLTPSPGDSIPLCGVRILSVDVDTLFSTPYPSNFDWNWQVWQEGDSLGINDVIDIDTADYITRVCLRITSVNPPQPISSQDVLVINVKVRGMIDIGNSCTDVPGTDGEASFQFTFLLEPSLSGLSIINPYSNYLLYPNPVIDELTIQSNNASNHLNSKVTITDINGKAIMEAPYTNSNTSLNLNNLNSGIYFVIINNNQSKTIKKFIKK